MDAYNATTPRFAARSIGLPPDWIKSMKKQNVIEAIGIASCFLTLLTVTVLIRMMVYSYMVRRTNTVLYGSKHANTVLFGSICGDNGQEKQCSPTFPTATTARPSKPLSSQTDVQLQSVTLA